MRADSTPLPESAPRSENGSRVATFHLWAEPIIRTEISMNDRWQEDVRAREEENRIAFLAADTPALDRLWTDYFVVNTPINVVNDKRRTLALLEAGRIRHMSLTFEIEHMSRHGDVVVVM